MENNIKKIEAKILQILKKEGGAAGLKPIKQAVDKMDKPKGFNLNKTLSKMANVEKHKHSDYILTPLNEAAENILEILTEKLCPKGKAYVARRKAAGEKHGAYLMGRAVKVCKGQMSGKKKKKKNEDAALSLSKDNMSSYTSKNENDGNIKFINKFNPAQRIIDMYDENPHLKKPLSSLSKYKKIQAIDQLRTHFSTSQAKRDMIKKEDRFDSSLAEIIEAWADDYYKDSDFFSYGMYVDKDYFNFFNANKDLLLKKYKKQQIPYNEINLSELKDLVRQELEEKKKGKCKPSKGKRFAKRVNGKCRSFGQKGKAKGGGDRIRPGTAKGNAYCARSAKIKKCKNPPCANALSRKKWKCQGSRSVAEAVWTD